MEDKKLNILIVHNYYKQSGGEGIVVNNEVENLRKHGNEVFLYTKNNNDIKNYNIFQKLLLPINYLFNFSVFKDIRKIIDKHNIDIIHVHNTSNIISYSVYYAAFSKKIPVVQTVHNYRFICPNALLYIKGEICEKCINKGLCNSLHYKCYRNSIFQTLLVVLNMKIQRRLKLYSKLNYICLTEFGKQKLLSLKQIKEKNIYIKPNYTYNIVDIAKLNIKRKNQIVFAGRLDEYKGIKFLINVWEKYGKILPKLIVFGSGDLYDWCIKTIRNKNICNVEMKGQTDISIIKKTISESLATISASKMYESFGLTIIDSYSCSTPVIVPDLDNFKCLVNHGETGFIYEHCSLESCKNAILSLYSRIDLYKNAYKEYLNKYTPETNYITLMNIYTSVLYNNKYN